MTDCWCGWHDVAVKLLRRILAALMMAVAAAGAIRTRGRGGTPPQHGGWQPVSVDDADALADATSTDRAESTVEADADATTVDGVTES